MTEKEEKGTIIATRIATMIARKQPPSPGAIEAPCDRCSEIVSLSPASQAILKEHPEYWVFCEECIPLIMQKEIDAGEEIKVQYAGSMHPGLDPELPADLRELVKHPEALAEAFRWIYDLKPRTPGDQEH